MFAAGRAAATADRRDDDNGDAWLQVGRSFRTGGEPVGLSEDARREKKRRRGGDEDVSEEERSRALVVHARHRSKAEKRGKKSKKKRSREDKKQAKQKRKKKERRHRRSEYSSASSDASGTSDDMAERRLTRRRRSRSRSASRGHELVSAGSTRELARSQPSTLAAAADQERLFEEDRVGDRDNQRFGSVYAGDQPLYALATRRTLGTGAWVASSRGGPSSARVEARRKREEERQRKERYFGLDARRAERSGQQRRLYLAYSAKRCGRHRESASSAAAEMAYIPLDPVVDPVVDVVAADVAESEGPVADIVALTDAQNAEQLLVTRTKLLNTTVAENPRDVGAWLDLMAFQDQTLQLVQGRDKKALAAARRNIFDKQAAILDKAVAHNPKSRELQRVKINLRLHMSRLQDGGDDHDAALQLLESLIERDPTDPELWRKLLECRQQNFSSFSVPSTRNLFARIFAVYRKQFEATRGDAETQALLSGLLVHFHGHMCAFEHKTGHLEHAIAHLQAQIDFNSGSQRQLDAARPHHELLHDFADRWSRDLARFGDADGLSSDSLRKLLSQGVLHTDSELMGYLESMCVTKLSEINPPDAVRGRQHKQHLLSASAAYRRRINRLKVPHSALTDDSGIKEGELEQDGDNESEAKLVYSNLHGYRILVDEANDAAEYERILSELRGTEASQARQEQAAARDEKRLAGVVAAVEEVEDQRADFDSVSRDDPFVEWLTREETQEQTQWQPLWGTCESHLDLIEAAPERAVLTDELQPFLFKILPRHQWALVANLLKMCGVSIQPDQDSSIYADSFSADCSPLANPLLRALDSSCTKPLAMTPQDRLRLVNESLVRCVRVEKATALDGKRVAFIRRIFAQTLSMFQGQSKEDMSCDGASSTQMVKCLWIGFEAELAAHLSKVGGDSVVAFARSVSQHLLQDQSSYTDQAGSSNPHADLVVLFEYAKLEDSVGNGRQVRRVFEKTLASLREAGDIERDFQRLVFLRARQELWSTSESKSQESSTDRKKTKKRANLDDNGVSAHKLVKLRTLYILWCVWQPAHEPLDALVKMFREDPATLVHRHLQRMEDPQEIASLEATYRSELDYAIREASPSCSCLTDTVDASRHSRAVPYSVSCVAGFCLHNLALVVYCSRGLEAACELYREFLLDKSKPACLQSRPVWLSYLEMMQQHRNAVGAFPSISPRRWRTAVERAVHVFPHDTVLLRLFIDAETGATMSQALRTHFLRVEKQSRRHFDSPQLAEWLFTLTTEIARIERAAFTAAQVSGGTTEVSTLSATPDAMRCCVFHRWGANTAAVARVRATFESMVSQVRTRGCALAWRLYVRFEIALGRVNAAKKVYYRALAKCPWSKALYLDGVRVLRPYLSEEECQEVIDFMAAKELHIRVEM